MIAPRRFEFIVAPDDAGLRLDQLLDKRVDGLSRRQARVARTPGVRDPPWPDDLRACEATLSSGTAALDLPRPPSTA
jgi:hypothetical protein